MSKTNSVLEELDKKLSICGKLRDLGSLVVFAGLLWFSFLSGRDGFHTAISSLGPIAVIVVGILFILVVSVVERHVRNNLYCQLMKEGAQKAQERLRTHESQEDKND